MSARSEGNASRLEDHQRKAKPQDRHRDCDGDGCASCRGARTERAPVSYERVDWCSHCAAPWPASAARLKTSLGPPPAVDLVVAAVAGQCAGGEKNPPRLWGGRGWFLGTPYTTPPSPAHTPP